MPNQGGETRHFVVPSEDRGKRLDQVLAAQYDDLSRARCQSLIRAGHLILKEEVCVDPAYKLRGGEPLSLTLPTVSPTMLEPEDRLLDIVFEDETLLVLNKPPDLVVHPGAGHQQGTLVHALLHHCKGQLSGIGGVERPGIVHRLDKDTSGLLVVAKTDPAHQELARQFAEREVQKIYLAVAWGTPKSQRWEVKTPIGRHPVDRQRMAVRDNGRVAHTTFVVHRQLKPNRVLLACLLHTGRTHQIRVHLQHSGHYLLGDPVYGGPAKTLAARPLLHSWRLSFGHPVTKAEIKCEAPPPEDMPKPT